MDILELIKKDHKEVLGLIADLENKSSDPDADVTDIVRQLAIDVILHAKVEQIALYTPIAEIKEDFRDFALEGKVEHKLAEVTLKKLVKHQPGGDGEFKATLSVVKELIHHHAEEEEEGELFPKLEKVLNETQRTQMGQRFIELKETMRSRVEELVDQSMLTPQSTTIDVTDSSKRAH